MCVWFGVFSKNIRIWHDNINTTVSIQVIDTWRKCQEWRVFLERHPKMVSGWFSLSFLHVWCAMEERTYSMEDLCNCVRMTWTHKSIQAEGSVCSGQLSICSHMTDSEGLRQKNQNNRRQVCMGEQDQVWHHLGIYQEHFIDDEYKESKTWECVKQWCNEVKGCKSPLNIIGQGNNRCVTGWRPVCIILILALLFSVVFLLCLTL